jgi:hypothetical protein
MEVTMRAGSTWSGVLATAVFWAGWVGITGCSHSGAPQGPGGVPPAPPSRAALPLDLEPPDPSGTGIPREPGPPTFSLSPQNAPVSSPVPSAVAGPAHRACIDSELRRRGLNAYGDRPGTPAPVGPLAIQSERTQDALDRYDAVLRRHPEIGAACIRTSTPP